MSLITWPVGNQAEDSKLPLISRLLGSRVENSAVRLYFLLLSFLSVSHLNMQANRMRFWPDHVSKHKCRWVFVIVHFETEYQ